MKKIGLLPFLLAVVMLAGCATTFRPWMLSEVREGMSREQVVSLLGEPDYVEQKAGVLYLHYTYSEGHNPITPSGQSPFSDTNPSLRDLELQNMLKVYHYVVILVDDKMQNYKELQD